MHDRRWPEMVSGLPSPSNRYTPSFHSKSEPRNDQPRLRSKHLLWRRRSSNGNMNARNHLWLSACCPAAPDVCGGKEPVPYQDEGDGCGHPRSRCVRSFSSSFRTRPVLPLGTGATFSRRRTDTQSDTISSAMAERTRAPRRTGIRRPTADVRPSSRHAPALSGHPTPRILRNP